MDMDISMDIHAKSVDMDMDMDGKFHIHGNPGNFTQSIPIALVSREQDRLQCALKDTVAYSRFTQFARQCIPDGRTTDREGPPTKCATSTPRNDQAVQVADRQCRLATSATEVQQLTRYLGALFSRHRRTMTASLYSTRLITATIMHYNCTCLTCRLHAVSRRRAVCESETIPLLSNESEKSRNVSLLRHETVGALPLM